MYFRSKWKGEEVDEAGTFQEWAHESPESGSEGDLPLWPWRGGSRGDLSKNRSHVKQEVEGKRER